MLRFYYVIIINVFAIMYFVPKMAHYASHPEKYGEEERYALARQILRRVKRNARVTTEYYGVENLPKSGGYIMYSNHQGKYDTVGIMSGHSRPCTVLMDKKRSETFIAKQFVDLIQGQRIDKESTRQQIKALNRIAEEVEKGRIYLVFPEGMYRKDQDNSLNEFKKGCFICAKKAKCSIVPVAIIDSYKPFGKNSLKTISTKVIFMPPVPYEEYSGMRTCEISDMVRDKIKSEIFRWVR